jgi:hypothetical protein
LEKRLGTDAATMLFERNAITCDALHRLVDDTKSTDAALALDARVRNEILAREYAAEGTASYAPL